VDLSKPTAFHKTSQRLFLLPLKKTRKPLHPLKSTTAGFDHFHHDLLHQILHTSSLPPLSSVKSLEFYTSGVCPDYALVLILQHEGEVATWPAEHSVPFLTILVRQKEQQTGWEHSASSFLVLRLNTEPHVCAPLKWRGAVKLAAW